MAIKEEVLKILEAHRGKAVSGQAIAEELGVTRAAVWKGIEALRQQGCLVDSCPHKGYTLGEYNDFITPQGIEAAFRRLEEKPQIKVFDTVASTNTKAREMALEGAPHNTLIVAREQTAGRGRQGRSFFSLRDKGIYMSLLLRPKVSLEQAQLFTVAAGVAVCRVIESSTSEKPKIKWVNDIFIDSRKVCGILTEALGDLESGGVEALILGIGLNISAATADFPPELQSVAGSLHPKKVTKNTLIAAMVEEIAELIANVEDPRLMAVYKDHSLVLGKTVEFSRGDRCRQGIAKDINSHGNLVVETSEGTEILCGGEISLRSENYADSK